MRYEIAFIQNWGAGEILIILVIVLLLFGANRLPGLARSLGRSLNEFKKGRDEGEKGAAKGDEPNGKKEEKPE